MWLTRRPRRRLLDGFMRIGRPIAAAWLLLIATGCSAPTRRYTTSSTTTIVSTSTVTSTAQPPPLPAAFALAAAEVPARPPGRPLPSGEVDGWCPYIKAGLNVQVDPSGNDFADLEGDRVQRVTILQALTPVGCRFYFQHDYHPIGDILPMTYSSPIEAHNALVETAALGSDAYGVPSFVPGFDGISSVHACTLQTMGRTGLSLSLRARFSLSCEPTKTRTFPPMPNTSPRRLLTRSNEPRRTE